MDAADEAVLGEARDLLSRGDAPAAHRALRRLVDMPAVALKADGDWSRAFALLTELATAFGAIDDAKKIAAVARAPSSVQALYDAGYALYEQKQFGTAATLFSRANQLAPGKPAIVSELSASLEATMQYGLASLAIEASGLAGKDPIITYLGGFNALMNGDVPLARARFAQLPAGGAEPLGTMHASLGAKITRALALQAAKIDLGEHALTAWHAIINGVVLTHESRHGYDQPMRGRYAYVGDSPATMREGLERLGRVVAESGKRVARVVAAPDRASRILAIAASKLLGLPLVEWKHGEVGPGVVVVWELDALKNGEFFRAAAVHAPEQLLFVHASSWVDPFPYAPDVTTLLHQLVTNPYTGGALRVDPKTNQSGPAEPDVRDDEELAAEILAAPPNDPSMSSMERVLEVMRALQDVPESQGLGARRSRGKRCRQHAGGPVPSARFT